LNPPILEFEACRAYGEFFCYFKYELENVIVQSVEMQSEPGGGIFETVSFSYESISWTYVVTERNGTAGETVGPRKWSMNYGHTVGDP
jgi:type VI secretion system secreted protein Hcp